MLTLQVGFEIWIAEMMTIIWQLKTPPPPTHTHTHTKGVLWSGWNETLKRTTEPALTRMHAHAHTLSSATSSSCCRSTAGAVLTAGQRGVLRGWQLRVAWILMPHFGSQPPLCPFCLRVSLHPFPTATLFYVFLSLSLSYSPPPPPKKNQNIA